MERDKLAHVEVLCEAEAPLNTIHMSIPGLLNRGRTAVQVAVESGSPEMLRMLLHYGADVDHPPGCYFGATCLKLAARAGDIGLVRFLLDRGSKVNAKRALFHGRTAIEIAAEYGRLDVLKLLLLQKEHLFHTPAERYQFIRATRLAEIKGAGAITEMLKQHISWNSNDEQLFDEIEQFVFWLDEMTQKPLDSERLDPDLEFWDWISMQIYRSAVGNVDSILVGIKKWIWGPAKKEDNDASTAKTDCSFAEESNVPADISFASSHYRKATKGGICEGLGHQPATQNATTPGLVMWDLMDEAPLGNDKVDDTVDCNHVENFGETDHLHGQHFNWGFWDDESFEFQSGLSG